MTAGAPGLALVGRAASDRGGVAGGARCCLLVGLSADEPAAGGVVEQRTRLPRVRAGRARVSGRDPADRLRRRCVRSGARTPVARLAGVGVLVHPGGGLRSAGASRASPWRRVCFRGGRRWSRRFGGASFSSCRSVLLRIWSRRCCCGLPRRWPRSSLRAGLRTRSPAAVRRPAVGPRRSFCLGGRRLPGWPRTVLRL